ncbi:helix-turn-helix domain-containing protein [Pontixanthobacter aestiaquae]|uniref:TetR family transcriptional regulator n=1 Tax=Pontixanthobacter aestiaquae TaxID=1509367 RepID=A0A844Z7F7_9SPHN|nr:TetR family transcriptional regulator [Pontixanthobacter aestiaquae]MDN3645819.1 helix-turn-helix domain-containing protein [Pontixanthobacter aestiaquae]MXO83186.1 TetR family transcriptional regulator [Pontixanthobacter aestiaquae]
MTTRKRLTPEESRSSALEAARALLIETGPQSVTLKAVSARVGRTHANLLHHFGSASGLQKALAAHLATTVCETIKDAVRASRAGLGSPREVVDLAFDAFDKEGAGGLASWMLLTGNEDALDPIIETIHQVVDELAPEEAENHGGVMAMHENTLTLVLLALGDALMGKALARALNLPDSAARDRAEALLTESIEARTAEECCD